MVSWWDSVMGSFIAIRGSYQLSEDCIAKSIIEKQSSTIKTEDKMNYEASLKRKRDAESVRLTQERIGRENGLKEGLEKGLKKGMEKGMEKGLEKGMEKVRAMALKLKDMGIPIEEIAKGTGLSVEEIEKL